MEEQTTLSDNQRRLVCRIVFLVLCALPTAIVSYALSHQATADDWQNLIRAQLGIPVQIASVETPVPFTTVLRGVRIPQSFLRSDGELVGDLLVEEIRIDRGDTRNVITVVQPFDVPRESLSQIVERFMEHLGQIDFDHHVWRLEFAKIVLTDKEPGAEFDLKPVVMDLVREKSADDFMVQGTLLTRVPNLEPNLPEAFSTLELKFNDQSFELATGTGGIPVNLLRYWYPDLRWLGANCHFQGRFKVDDIRSGAGSVEGKLFSVELDRLSSPYSLGVVGKCDVDQIRCSFQKNQFEYANLRMFSVQPINVPASFLAAVKRLGIQTGEIRSHGIYTFPNLDLQITINKGQLIFSGSDGSVISRNPEGEALISVFNADVSVHDLAGTVMGDTFSEEAVAFIRKFRLPQRLARDSTSPTIRK